MQELDSATVKRAQSGDRAAQEALLRRYVRPLHAFVRRAGAGHDADDITQELLAKLLRVLPQFELSGPASLSTWVFTMAHRSMIDDKRRRHLSVAPLDEGLEVPDAALAVDEALHGKQLGAELERAIAALPEAQRRVFVLFNTHRQPLEAIAQVENVPVGTLKSRLHRARAALALALMPLLEKPRPGADHVRIG